MPLSHPSAAADPGTAGETTRDRFLGGKITITQPKNGPRGAIDAVFLAAAVPARSGERALDMGAGTGLVAIALGWRVPGLQVTCIERQADLCRLAQENLAINGLENRASIVEADVTAPLRTLEAAGLAPEQFHHVAANPPFFEQGSARTPSDPGKAESHMAEPGALGEWMRFAAAMAAPRGTLTMIHRPEALTGILSGMEGRFGGISVMPLLPASGRAASRIIVQGIKGSRAPLRLLDGLVLHEPGGGYTRQADAMLRDGQALELSA